MDTKPILNIPVRVVDSSQIYGIGHDEATRTLAVRFKKAGEASTLYHFSNVAPETFAALRDAASIGSYFGKYIKAFPEQYPFQRISE